jgi:hypothetical protein
MCLTLCCVHSFIWGHLAMCITTLYPIYEFYYPDADDEEVALQAAGTEIKLKFDDMAQGTPMEEVAGFSLPAAAPGDQAYPVQQLSLPVQQTLAQSDLELQEYPQQTGQA